MVGLASGVIAQVELYDVERIAKLFGVKIRTVQEWIRRDELPVSKVGKAYFATEEDIAEFLRRKKKQPGE